MTKMYPHLSSERRNREIGSYFDLDSTFTLPFMRAGYTCISTCRSAIDLILKETNFENKIALLPAFTCHAVVEPFIKNGFKVYPYSLKKDLFIDEDEFLRAIHSIKPSVVLVHSFFGFDTAKLLKKESIHKMIGESGICLIEDQTQTMFSDHEEITAHYYIGSIRKWLGMPDGAYISKKIKLDEEDIELSNSKVCAMRYKNRFLVGGVGTKENLLNKYKAAEKILDSRTEMFKMSSISQTILERTDFQRLKEQRRRNFSYLLANLKTDDNIRAIFPIIDDMTVPFFFPVYVKKKRKDIQRFLAENGIFATVIWACPNEFKPLIDETALQIYDEILCIPCDQRYSEEDMKYICAVYEKYKKS